MMKSFLIITLFSLIGEQFYVNAAHIPMEIVDMTHVFDDTTLAPSGQHNFKLSVTKNGTIGNGKFWLQLDEINTTIHMGTHMDAPCHVIKGAKCVDKLPLNDMIAPAAVIDVIEQVQKNRDYLVQSEDLQKWEHHTGQKLDGTIVLIKTGYGRLWSNKEAYFGTDDDGMQHFPGMSIEASEWLVNNRNVRGLGVETASLDYGPSDEDKAHHILLGANRFGLENVANMDKIPIQGATLIALPMKVGNGSGAPVRIIAMFPKHLAPQNV